MFVLCLRPASKYIKGYFRFTLVWLLVALGFRGEGLVLLLLLYALLISVIWKFVKLGVVGVVGVVGVKGAGIV